MLLLIVSHCGLQTDAIRQIQQLIRDQKYNDVVIYVCNRQFTGCEAQLAGKCLFMPTFGRLILASKVCQTDLVLGL